MQLAEATVAAPGDDPRPRPAPITAHQPGAQRFRTPPLGDPTFHTPIFRDELEIEFRLVALARSGGALRRALAVLAMRLVATRAGERIGFAWLADYAGERLGLSARSLQDLAQVGSKLRDLSRLGATLASGRLSWTQTRLLARVTTGADEASWIEAARGFTARALARRVRAVDVASLEAGAAHRAAIRTGPRSRHRECVQIRCTPEVNARRYFARRLARRMAGDSHPVWVSMERVVAETLSALPLDSGLEGVESES